MPNYLNYPDCAAAASHPLKIGDGYCNHGYGGNTAECGFDGGDCDDWNAKFSNCNTDYPMDIGNGSCMDNYGANTAECDFDGGDCYYSNFMKKYPNCVVYDILRIGDGRCDGNYNTAECGFDLGDCGNPNPFPVWSVVGGVAGAFLFIAIGIVIGKKKWNTSSTMQETAAAAGGGGVQTGNAKDDMDNQQEEPPFSDVEATGSSARNIHKPVLQSQDNRATLGREFGSEASGEEEFGSEASGEEESSITTTLVRDRDNRTNNYVLLFNII